MEPVAGFGGLARAAFRVHLGDQEKEERGIKMHGPLRSVARRLIEEGRLPKDSALRVYGGPSEGTICRLCGQPIGAQAPEIELETLESNGVLLHPDCYAVWLAEVRSYGS